VKPEFQYAGGYTNDQLTKMNNATNLGQEAAIKSYIDQQNAPKAEAALKAGRTQDEVDADTKADKVKAAQGQAAASGGAYDTEGNYYSSPAEMKKAADAYNTKQNALKAATDKLNGTAGVTSGSDSSADSGSGASSQQSQGWQYQSPTPEQEKQNKLDTAKANGWGFNKQGFATESDPNDVIDERPGHENSGSRRKSGASLWGGF
jgi:hypothetical protein